MVPDGWDIQTIADIAKVTSGGTPSRKNDAYWEGNIPWVTTAEVHFNTIVDSEQKITKSGLDNSSAKLFPSDTILMAMYGQGKTRGQVAKLGIEASTNQACAAILLKDNLSTDYYYLFLQSQYKNIRNLSNSGGQKNLSACLVKSIKVPVPPLLEQKKIAKILSTWDRAIEVTEKQISNSQQQKKFLMHQLLTGKKRLPGFSGEWEKKVLSKIADIVMGSSPKSESYNNHEKGLPLLQGNADIKNRLSAPRAYTSQITKECLVDDILLSVRAPVGEVSRSIHHACIGRGIAAIRAKEDTSQNYLYQWLLYFEPKWEKLSQGSTFEAVNSNDIKTLYIDVPQKEEQQKIALILFSADKEIETLKQKLECVRQEKKALMQQLLTGKRRVKIDEDDVPIKEVVRA